MVLSSSAADPKSTCASSARRLMAATAALTRPPYGTMTTMVMFAVPLPLTEQLASGGCSATESTVSAPSPRITSRRSRAAGCLLMKHLAAPVETLVALAAASVTMVDMRDTTSSAHSEAAALAGPVMTMLAEMTVWLRETSDGLTLGVAARVGLRDVEEVTEARGDGDAAGDGLALAEAMAEAVAEACTVELVLAEFERERVPVVVRWFDTVAVATAEALGDGEDDKDGASDRLGGTELLADPVALGWTEAMTVSDALAAAEPVTDTDDATVSVALGVIEVLRATDAVMLAVADSESEGDDTVVALVEFAQLIVALDVGETVMLAELVGEEGSTSPAVVDGLGEAPGDDDAVELAVAELLVVALDDGVTDVLAELVGDG